MSAVEDIFYIEPVTVDGEILRAQADYSDSHSEVFAKIAARIVIEEKPPSATDLDGKTLASFYDTVVQTIQMQYLMGNPGTTQMVYRTVETYLSRYPDERIESFLRFSKENPPVLEPEFLGDLEFDRPRPNHVTEKRQKAEKHRKKMAQASKRKNRRR